MQETDTNHREDRSGVLKDGGVVVVVGTRSTNVPGIFRANPRFVFFDSTDPATGKRSLPTNTKALVMTRWVGHPVYDKYIAEARARNILIVPELHSTGRLRKVLNSFLPTDVDVEVPIPIPTPPLSSPEATPMPTSVKRKQMVPRGSLKELMQHADFTAPIRAELERLDKLARERGLVTSQLSLLKAYQRAKAAVRTAPKPVPIPTVGSPSVAEILKTLDDSIAGLQLVRESVEQVMKESDRLQQIKVLVQGLGL